GQPPPAPKFWSAALGHPDVGDGSGILSRDLLLCWRPQPDSVAAFFSLEMSGPQGSKAFKQGLFKEICRDPPDADGEPEYQIWVPDLQPNTTYDFRIRAFNGFGPGAYTHKAFTTRPNMPPTPVVTRVTPTEASLQW
ncbi:unnamed protein product, partial [Chrysoparadoxa australica]